MLLLGGKWSDDCRYPKHINFCRIHSRTICKINIFLCSTQKFKMAAKKLPQFYFFIAVQPKFQDGCQKLQKKQLGENRQMTADTLGSRTISMINMFYISHRNSRWPLKWGKQFFVKSLYDSVDTLEVNISLISLYFTPVPR